MKKITLILISMLFFLVGGVSSQTQTSLVLKGGSNWEGTSGGNLGNNRDCTSDVIQFKDKRAQYSYMTNNDWVDATEGTHTFVVTLGSSNNEDCTLHIAALNEVVSGSSFDNGNIKSGIIIKEESISVTNNATLTLSVSSGYAAIILWQTSNSDWRKVNIASFTRTVSAASSVAAPTITPASGTYDGDLTVTITKGAGNSKVVYSVIGATTGNIENDYFMGDSKELNLTGSGTITVNATGYDNENNTSSLVTNTYTYNIPSGQSSTTSGLPHKFQSWDGGNSITFANSVFSNIKEGDYVVLDVADVEKDGTVLGFRKGWDESPYVSCTTTSGGNGAKGTLNKGDSQWWMKVNNDVVSALKNNEVRMQGGMVPNDGGDISSSVTLNSLKVYECKALNESSDNLISSKINNVVVELTRSFVKDMWNTVCLPFTLTSAQATQLFGSGYQLTQFTSVSGTTMQFTTTNSFVAGVPYLVKPTIDVSSASPVVLVDVDITAKTPQTVTHDGYSFVGNFTQKTFSGDECNTSRFVATGNELKKPNDNSTLKSLRCYFTVPATAAARSLSFDVDEEGNTTGVADINRETITNNGDFFNLAGQRVAKPTKGLYIVNGKKVVIK